MSHAAAIFVKGVRDGTIPPDTSMSSSHMAGVLGLFEEDVNDLRHLLKLLTEAGHVTPRGGRFKLTSEQVQAVKDLQL